MQSYQYKYGDRPLEGYTIQRAAGRGGFGEVYYAVSDGGREVALKAVQTYEQIELRGITQCMNLKSPHLVTIFDVKYNEQNKPFVVMEYVSGPSLRDLLAESPGGLGTQKAAFFLREIAKGLNYLHECGIVHRDLKPSNIFYENGLVKIGDYGLTKAINTSRHSAQTITVGTVHYMAPEIGVGNYDRGIDIYALGILLYEMLTGQVPFFGASPAEVLMKHMSTEPDLKGLEEPFTRVIKKALAKDPADRYKSVQEMVEDVFGTEHIRNSVSQFSPEDLSVIAGHVAKKVKTDVPQQTAQPAADVTPVQAAGVNQQNVMPQPQQQYYAHAGVAAAATRVEALTIRQRKTLLVITVALMSAGCVLLTGSFSLSTFVSIFIIIAISSTTLVYCINDFRRKIVGEVPFYKKVAACYGSAFFGVIGSYFFQLFSYAIARGNFRGDLGPQYGILNFIITTLSLSLPLLLVDFNKLTSTKRQKTISLKYCLLTGFMGFILTVIFRQAAIEIVCILAGIIMVVQLNFPIGSAVGSKPVTKTKPIPRLVPGYVRALWLLSSLLFTGVGIMLLIFAGVEARGDDFGFCIAFGVASLITALFCFIGVGIGVFKGWYRYLIKPLLLYLCVTTIVVASIFLGLTHWHGSEMLVPLFFIIFPSLAFIGIAAVPASAVVGSLPRSKPNGTPAQYNNAQTRNESIQEILRNKALETYHQKLMKKTKSQAAIPAGVSSYKRLWALLLSLMPFFMPGIPVWGIHRFYTGRVWTGLLWFFTFGLFGIGQVIDIILIIAGQFKDQDGLPLLIWNKETPSSQYIAAKTSNQAPVRPAPVQARQSQQQQSVQPAARPVVNTAGQRKAAVQYIPSGTKVYPRFNPISSLFSLIGYLLLLCAVILGLSVGFHVPGLISAGWPDPDLANELYDIFRDSNWPSLMERLGTIAVFFMVALSAIFLIIGRRHYGAGHLVRAVLALIGFMFAFAIFSEAVIYSLPDDVASYLNEDQIGPAIEKILDACSQEDVVKSLIVFIVSVLILAWPPKQKIVYTPLQQQGAV